VRIVRTELDRAIKVRDDTCINTIFQDHIVERDSSAISYDCLRQRGFSRGLLDFMRRAVGAGYAAGQLSDE